jgi:hypothetical protein
MAHYHKQRNEGETESMNLHWFKHHTCPDDEEEATLLVDVETETIPKRDEDGNLLYYCVEGQHVFPVDEDGGASLSESRKRR